MYTLSILVVIAKLKSIFDPGLLGLPLKLDYIHNSHNVK